MNIESFENPNFTPHSLLITLNIIIPLPFMLETNIQLDYKKEIFQ